MNNQQINEIIEALSNIEQRLQQLENQPEKVALNNSLTLNNGIQVVQLSGNLSVADLTEATFSILEKLQPKQSNKLSNTYLG